MTTFKIATLAGITINLKKHEITLKQTISLTPETLKQAQELTPFLGEGQSDIELSISPRQMTMTEMTMSPDERAVAKDA